MIRSLFARRAPIPDSVPLMLDTGPVSVRVRVNARARSYRLTLSRGGVPVLTVPSGGDWSAAERFLDRHRGWLTVRLKRAPGALRLLPGHEVPLRGEPHLIVASGKLRGLVNVLPDADPMPTLSVPGAPDHHERRLIDWLKAEALADLTMRVDHHAARLDVRVSGLTIRDQSSRWGSCSSAGRLNFNWRLILAPPFVLDYVAAHEVAHRLEMNHSPAFWAHVTHTLPDMARGRAWLKAHGTGLMAYGQRPD